METEKSKRPGQKKMLCFDLTVQQGKPNEQREKIQKHSTFDHKEFPMVCYTQAQANTHTHTNTFPFVCSVRTNFTEF